MSKRSFKIAELPEDLQVLIFQLVEDSAGQRVLKKLETHKFRVRHLPIELFPSQIALSDYRGEAYASRMIGQQLPPVVICGDKWLDGRHRVWVWRRSGATTIPCIDLAELGISYRFIPLAQLGMNSQSASATTHSETQKPSRQRACIDGNAGQRDERNIKAAKPKKEPKTWGTKVVEKLRPRMNKLTAAERKRLLVRAMQIAYGDVAKPADSRRR